MSNGSKAADLADAVIRFAVGHGLQPEYTGAALTAAVVGYARLCGLTDNELRRALETAMATSNGQRIEVMES